MSSPAGSRAKAEPLRLRPSKVQVEDFARPYRRGMSVAEFLEGLPRVLAGGDLQRLARAVVEAKRRRKPILWGIGGHVIKVGVSPVLIRLMASGFVTGLASAGAALIHDFEIALAGHTSEDVEAQLKRGRYGQARETSAVLNRLAREARRSRGSFAARVGEYLERRGDPRFLDCSLLVAAVRHQVPFTVHLGIGADIFHMSPNADGAALGECALRDFREFCRRVRQLDGGGVYLNVGSAVQLPEVFLKALAAAQASGRAPRGFTTANLDFIQHYRPTQNVVLRPSRVFRSQGIALTGSHELLLPLLGAAILEEEAKSEGP